MELADFIAKITPLEAAARKLCEYYGVDPDETTPLKPPNGLGIAILVPRWKNEAAHILRHRMIEIVNFETVEGYEASAPLMAKWYQELVQARNRVAELEAKVARLEILVPDENPQDE